MSNKVYYIHNLSQFITSLRDPRMPASCGKHHLYVGNLHLTSSKIPHFPIKVHDSLQAFKNLTSDCLVAQSQHGWRIISHIKIPDPITNPWPNLIIMTVFLEYDSIVCLRMTTHLKAIYSISYMLCHEYRVARNQYSWLLFTSEDCFCANLHMQQQSTNMMSQYQYPTFVWHHRSTVVTSQY